jgi:hypothetical protein
MFWKSARKPGRADMWPTPIPTPIMTSPQPYTASSLDVQDPVLAAEISQEMLDYFYEQGYDPDSPPLTEFISSAENEKRLKRKRERYKASFF